MADVHDVRFPDQIAQGATGGPTYSTSISKSTAGFETRIGNWAYPLHKYNVATGLKDQDGLRELLAFFHARMGALYGFRFKDWADFTVLPSEMGPTIDGAPTKVYSSGGVNQVRRLTRVVAASGIEILVGDTYVAPALEFDVPCRFESDDLSLQVEQLDVGGIPNINIIEVREALAAYSGDAGGGTGGGTGGGGGTDTIGGGGGTDTVGGGGTDTVGGGGGGTDTVGGGGGGTDPLPAGSTLFAGNFSGATLNAPSGDFSTITGTDDTGYTWDDTFWNGNWGVHHYNFGNASSIISTTGPDGAAAKAIHLAVTSGSDSQAQETMMLNPATGTQGPFYYRAWYRLTEDVAAQLTAGGPYGGVYKDWRNIWEAKSGDPTGGNAGQGDFRLSLGFHKTVGGTFWKMQVDTNANYNPQSEVPFVIYDNRDIAAPIPAAGQWFLMETYVDRGTLGADNGTWWVKINGTTLYTHTGKMWGIKSKPWNRIMNITYTNATTGHSMDVTDIEIANSAP